MGGSMRQSGILTAACLYALDHNIERLADDHSLAQSIAARIEDLPGVESVTAPETNLLFFDLAEGFPDVNGLVDTMRGASLHALSQAYPHAYPQIHVPFRCTYAHSVLLYHTQLSLVHLGLTCLLWMSFLVD